MTSLVSNFKKLKSNAIDKIKTNKVKVNQILKNKISKIRIPGNISSMTGGVVDKLKNIVKKEEKTKTTGKASLIDKYEFIINEEQMTEMLCSYLLNDFIHDVADGGRITNRGGNGKASANPIIEYENKVINNFITTSSDGEIILNEEGIRSYEDKLLESHALSDDNFLKNHWRPTYKPMAELFNQTTYVNETDVYACREFAYGIFTSYKNTFLDNIKLVFEKSYLLAEDFVSFAAHGFFNKLDYLDNMRSTFNEDKFGDNLINLIDIVYESFEEKYKIEKQDYQDYYGSMNDENLSVKDTDGEKRILLDGKDYALEDYIRYITTGGFEFTFLFGNDYWKQLIIKHAIEIIIEEDEGGRSLSTLIDNSVFKAVNDVLIDDEGVMTTVNYTPWAFEYNYFKGMSNKRKKTKKKRNKRKRNKKKRKITRKKKIRDKKKKMKRNNKTINKQSGGGLVEDVIIQMISTGYEKYIKMKTSKVKLVNLLKLSAFENIKNVFQGQYEKLENSTNFKVFSENYISLTTNNQSKLSLVSEWAKSIESNTKVLTSTRKIEKTIESHMKDKWNDEKIIGKDGKEIMDTNEFKTNSFINDLLQELKLRGNDITTDKLGCIVYNSPTFVDVQRNMETKFKKLRMMNLVSKYDSQSFPANSEWNKKHKITKKAKKYPSFDKRGFKFVVRTPDDKYSYSLTVYPDDDEKNYDIKVKVDGKEKINETYSNQKNSVMELSKKISKMMANIVLKMRKFFGTSNNNNNPVLSSIYSNFLMKSLGDISQELYTLVPIDSQGHDDDDDFQVANYYNLAKKVRLFASNDMYSSIRFMYLRQYAQNVNPYSFGGYFNKKNALYFNFPYKLEKMGKLNVGKTSKAASKAGKAASKASKAGKAGMDEYENIQELEAVLGLLMLNTGDVTVPNNHPLTQELLKYRYKLKRHRDLASEYTLDNIKSFIYPMLTETIHNVFLLDENNSGNTSVVENTKEFLTTLEAMTMSETQYTIEDTKKLCNKNKKTIGAINHIINRNMGFRKRAIETFKVSKTGNKIIDFKIKFISGFYYPLKKWWNGLPNEERDKILDTPMVE